MYFLVFILLLIELLLPPSAFGGSMYFLAFTLLLIELLFPPSVLAQNNTLGLPSLTIPQNNPQSKEKIALGRDFFHDPRFSKDGTVSCASCHQQSRAFTDGLSVAKGIEGKTGTRNAPTVVNAAFFESFFVDGRAKSLEEQALGPLTNPIEHGLENSQQILKVVYQNEAYKKRLQQIFTISEQEITVQHIAMAIASFERTLIAGNSPFDQYYFGGDRARLSDSAANGLRIFRRKGNCANCHEISWNNALFSDNRFYNIGVGFQAIQAELESIITATNTGKSADLSDEKRSQLGRFNVTHLISDMGKFKSPTLRNIALTGPYMHDGSMKTLRQVINYYDKGGDKNRFLDAAIFPLHLTEQEKSDLVEFMKSLTSPAFSQ